jgi:nucleotide-binding universal stress UspA family protein
MTAAKSILVPTDFSETSDVALPHAIDLAQALECSVDYSRTSTAQPAPPRKKELAGHSRNGCRVHSNGAVDGTATRQLSRLSRSGISG